MDQVEFERFIAVFARRYYAHPRSCAILTPYGSIDLACASAFHRPTLRYVLEDFAKFLTEEDVDSTTRR